MAKKKSKYNWTAALRVLKEDMEPEHYKIVVDSKGKSFDSDGKDLVKELVIEMYRNYRTGKIDREAYRRIVITNVVTGAIYRNFINRIQTGISEKGYSVVSTMATEEITYGSTYTVGLNRTLGYDLAIINNADVNNRHDVLVNTLANLNGLSKEDLNGALIKFNEGDRVQLFKVDNSKVLETYTPYVKTVLSPGTEVTVFQIVYPNTDGLLPSDEGYLETTQHPVFIQI